MGVVAAILAVATSIFGGTNPTQPKGFLAEPKSGRIGGVLVLHAWWGLNEDVKLFCNRLAESGLVAFAPDLFDGKIANTRKEAEALVHEYEPKSNDLEAKIARSAQFVGGLAGTGKVAVVGFSFGAYYALRVSNAQPNLVRSVVVYYGTGQEDFSKSQASYLGHFADHDEFEPKANVEHLAKLLKDSGDPAMEFTYPGTGHWFVEPSVKSAYNKEAAELAWSRTLRFLKESFLSQAK